MRSVLITSKSGREMAQVYEVFCFETFRQLRHELQSIQAEQGPEKRNECQGKQEPGAPI